MFIKKIVILLKHTEHFKITKSLSHYLCNINLNIKYYVSEYFIFHP